MRFCKMHGLGNDFVMINGESEILPQDLGPFCQALCDRNLGVGADGVIILNKTTAAGCDLQFTIYNSDGSLAEMCGNGIRCALLFAQSEKLCQKDEIVFATKAGKVIPRLIPNDLVRVNMGQPRLAPAEIPSLLPGKAVIDYPLEVLGRCYRITLVSMGNPHCVIFTDDLAAIPFDEVAPLLEKHPLFPAKINVHFAQKTAENTLRLQVWERGCGPTLACGTGACATAVAAALNGLTDKKVEIQLAYGSLFIEWAPDGNVYMTGPATFVFDGKL